MSVLSICIFCGFSTILAVYCGSRIDKVIKIPCIDRSSHYTACMDIVAISYHNIGPFCDKTLSVIFHDGKYLIQAPIGSGKSFLFFDGPIYGLYKYSTRRMLHIEEKK